AVNQLDAKIRCIGISVEREDGDIIVRRADCTLGETRIHAAMFGREASIVSRLVGRYNVANLLASSAALVSVGYDADAVSEALKNVPPVPGRLERIGSKDVYVFVDYAHTPDALVNAQRSLRELGSGRLITVFGCGGDRDRGKRPLMGEVVAQMSDYAVVTSDNPRTEEPERIIDDIVPGVLRESGRNGFAWKRIADRREAIAHAIEYARSGDVVLVAGKGHEDYQEIHGVRYEFKDQDVCRGVMANLGIL
ncbi:MAG TPA: cyanophycin synthetase, partial [Oligoflexia bacterium]|nr:cyanophycin synthetase [Oligoflexia bacterium]